MLSLVLNSKFLRRAHGRCTLLYSMCEWENDSLWRNTTSHNREARMSRSIPSLEYTYRPCTVTTIDLELVEVSCSLGMLHLPFLLQQLIVYSLLLRNCPHSASFPLFKVVAGDDATPAKSEQKTVDISDRCRRSIECSTT